MVWQLKDALAHAPALYSYAFSRVGDHHTAEDLIQDTFLSAWKASDSFKQDSSLLTWLTGILRHKILDYHRASYRNPLQMKQEALEAETDSDADSTAEFDAHGNWSIDPSYRADPIGLSPARLAENRELQRFIADCMEKLPVRMAELFLAREVDGLSVEAAAAQVGVTSGSAGVLLTRARKILRLCLQTSLLP